MDESSFLKVLFGAAIAWLGTYIFKVADQRRQNKQAFQLWQHFHSSFLEIEDATQSRLKDYIPELVRSLDIVSTLVVKDAGKSTSKAFLQYFIDFQLWAKYMMSGQYGSAGPVAIRLKKNIVVEGDRLEQVGTISSLEPD